MGLRVARQARGFSQQQLAGMAGISRQAISAVETGGMDPSLRVALALTRALGLSIEEVFGPGTPAPSVSVRPVAPLGESGARVALAPMGDTFVALPLTGAAASTTGFTPATGLAGEVWPGEPEQRGLRVSGSTPANSGPVRSVQPIGPPRPTLVVAGDDPALPLLAFPLSLLDPPVAFTWWPCSSQEALGLAAGGLVHAAGAHLRGGIGDDGFGLAGDLLRLGADVIGFCSWRVGLVMRPELVTTIKGVADLRDPGVRVVNRKPGAEARRVLDRALASQGIEPGQLRGYETRANGHLHVAAAIAAGLADVGVASEPAALTYDLGFVPLASERFDLVIPAATGRSWAVQGLLKVLSSPWLINQLGSVPGYDLSRCGKRIAVLRR